MIEGAFPFQGTDEAGCLPEIEGIDWNVAKRYLSDERLILDTVRGFWRLCDERAEELRKCYEESNIQNYRIKVHSMKSEAAMIGAEELSERARALETAAKSGQWNVIEADNQDFLTMWIGYKDKLSVIFEKEKQEKKSIDHVEVVLDHLQVLQTAMEDFDIGLADETMEILNGYQYDDEVQGLYLLLEKAVINFDPDAVGDAVRKLADYFRSDIY